MLLKELREQVCKANKELQNNGLVLWTSGNVSARDPETNYVVIKPSGVLFDDLKPEDIVVVDLEGNVIEGDLKPSVDTASHLVVYRERNDINGVVHTHSPYATSFAITGEPLEIYTTTSAAVFGEAIPISDFATIGEEEIGQEIVDKIGNNSAILIKNHGVFTIGKDHNAALKSAVVLEETAQSVHYAMCRKQIEPLSKEVVDAGYNVYKQTYGQKRMISLLKEILLDGNIKVVDNVVDWKDAVRKSCLILESQGAVPEIYKEKVIESVEELGPYIFLAPGVAMPHVQLFGETKVGLSLLKVNEEVEYDSDSKAYLFFAFSAEDGESHINMIQELATFLSDENNVNSLIELETLTDIEDYIRNSEV